jgi:hypothetical protein
MAAARKPRKAKLTKVAVARLQHLSGIVNRWTGAPLPLFRGQD